MNYEAFKSAYLKFSDRSDFVPSVNENGDVVIYYTGDSGYLKAMLLLFFLNTTKELIKTDKQHIYNLLESYEGLVEDVEDESMDILEDGLQDDSNILTSSYDDAPVIKLVNQIIIHAVKNGASDIHFECRDTYFIVRLRLDGVLTDFKRYPKSLHEPVIARIKVIASLDVAETRRPQDGRINLMIGNRTVDIRVSCMPSVNGEKVVLRVLERGTEFATLDKAGMQEEILRVYKPFLSKPNGIILVTGPTGSGKTTTLYASLLSMNRDSKNVLTIEDPVEYHLENITQVQVNTATGITFANAIRSFLRQDPDIILVGEIRDYETAEAAVQASLTGHLVLSTLHTNDSATAVSRLLEMGIEPFLISSALLVVVGQRLVRKICPDCKEYLEANESIKKIFKDNGIQIEGYYKGRGCSNCFNTGYKGRVGIFEVLTINDNIRNLINDKASSFEIKEEAKKHGFKTMFEHGASLVAEGITTPEEILSVTKSD